jgi:hypothetical protein
VTRLCSAECVEALRVRFGPPAFAFMEQVANGTGSRISRWADAVAMSIWPSRGLAVHGIEIKVDRQDWLRELKNPKKSTAVQEYCDKWWIATPAGLVKPEELPPTWGLIEVTSKKRTVVRVDAPELQPKPLDRSFVAAVLRRHAEAHDAIVKRESENAREDGAKNGAGAIAKRLERAEERADKLYEQLEKFRQTSGINIYSEWDMPELGKAIELVRRRRRDGIVEDFKRDAERYRAIATRLEEDAEEIAKLTEPLPKSEAAE